MGEFTDLLRTQASLAWLLLLCLVPAGALLVWFAGRDRHEPEPPGHVLFAFALGALSAPLALLVFGWLEAGPAYSNLGAIGDASAVEQFLVSFLVIGPVEELAKLLPLFLWLRWARVVDEPMDGLVYAAAAGLGFATIENWLFMLRVDEPVWSRALTLPVLHVCFSSFWGFGLGLAWAPRGQPGKGPEATALIPRPLSARRVALAGLFLAIAFHGLYDYVVFARDVPDWALLLLVLVLWVWLSVATRWADRHSPYR